MGRNSIACMAEARGGGVLGEDAANPSPPARGPRERCKLPQWGPGRSSGRNRFWCISKLVEGIKTVFTTKRDTVVDLFLCLIFPEISGGCSNTQDTPLVTALGCHLISQYELGAT